MKDNKNFEKKNEGTDKFKNLAFSMQSSFVQGGMKTSSFSFQNKSEGEQIQFLDKSARKTGKLPKQTPHNKSKSISPNNPPVKGNRNNLPGIYPRNQAIEMKHFNNQRTLNFDQNAQPTMGMDYNPNNQATMGTNYNPNNQATMGTNYNPNNQATMGMNFEQKTHYPTLDVDACNYPEQKTLDVDFSNAPIHNTQDVYSNNINAYEQKTMDVDFSHDTQGITNHERTSSGTPKPPANVSKKDPLGILGSTIIGKYEIVKFLGQGGMGAVYLGRHNVLGKERAIKFMLKTFNTDEMIVKRFVNEARAAARVEHQNIVQVYDIEEVSEYYFIIMQYVKGQGLDDYLTANGPMDPLQALDIIRYSAMGLQAIHDSGLIHRDIKPANLMLSDDGSVKITDFGIVKDIAGNTSLTATSTIIGTPQFMSPEQIKKDGMDHRSDIYSLGATFYTLVTNQPCFTGTTMQLIYQVLQAPPIPPHEININIDKPISELILKMMEKEPEKRPQSMNELVKEIDRLKKDFL